MTVRKALFPFNVTLDLINSMTEVNYVFSINDSNAFSFIIVYNL